MKRVRDLMTAEVFTLKRDDTLSFADRVMNLGRIRHIPVLDEKRRLVGLISQRDLFYNALVKALGHPAEDKREALHSISVKSVMTSDVITIEPDASLADAALLMTQHKIGCLPVIEDGQLVGILTETDFVATFAAPAEGE